MELEDVDVVSLHPGEALFDARQNIVTGEDMRTALATRGQSEAPAGSHICSRDNIQSADLQCSGQYVLRLRHNQSRYQYN
jgi:hypothetical protein